MRSRLFASLLAAALTSACGGHSPEHLPSVPPGADDAMVEAHATARSAYDRCLEDLAADETPSSLVLAGGAGVLGLGLVGGATTAAVLVDEPAIAGAVVAGLGLGAGAAFASTAFFATDIAPAQERAAAERRLLADAKARTEKALADNDTDAMARVARELYENCRAVQATADGQQAGVVIRDLQRYRRDLESRDAQLAGALKSREALEGEARELSGRVTSLDDEQQKRATRIKELESLAAEKEARNQSLQARVSDLEEERASLSQREKRLLEEKRKLEEKTGQYEEVAEALAAEVKDGRVMLRRLRDGVVVELPNAVLFPSGSAELNAAGKETLAKVAGAIKDLEDRRVRVEGHTDDVPVGGKAPFQDNWNLSAQRALTVTRFLQEAGVDPSLLSAEARSEYAPVAPNDDDSNRAKNRRIEIYLVPKPGGASETWRG